MLKTSLKGLDISLIHFFVFLLVLFYIKYHIEQPVWFVDMQLCLSSLFWHFKVMRLKFKKERANKKEQIKNIQIFKNYLNKNFQLF